MSEQRKTAIIGGVAGGASCAARRRRLDADREIVILERGAYISYRLYFKLTSAINRSPSCVVENEPSYSLFLTVLSTLDSPYP